MRSTVFSLATALLGLLLAAAPLVPGAEAGYWMDDVPHVGKSPFNTNPSYVVYRNVKAYGAKGDGGM
jgi:glucan 1,3-beta-glucosidase